MKFESLSLTDQARIALRDLRVKGLLVNDFETFKRDCVVLEIGNSFWVIKRLSESRGDLDKTTFTNELMREIEKLADCYPGRISRGD